MEDWEAPGFPEFCGWLLQPSPKDNKCKVQLLKGEVNQILNDEAYLQIYIYYYYPSKKLINQVIQAMKANVEGNYF